MLLGLASGSVGKDQSHVVVGTHGDQCGGRYVCTKNVAGVRPSRREIKSLTYFDSVDVGVCCLIGLAHAEGMSEGAGPSALVKVKVQVTPSPVE